MTHLPVQLCRMRIAPATLALGLCCLALPQSGGAQQAADSGAGLQATRVALQGVAQRLEQAGPAPDSSLYAAAIHARLTDGDFQPGDRILLTVDGEPQLPERPVPVQQPRTIERQLSDTFTVGAGRGPVGARPGLVYLAGRVRAGPP